MLILIVSVQGALALPNCPKWCKMVGNMGGSIFFSIGYKMNAFCGERGGA